MNKKVIILGSLAAVAAGFAYWYFVYSPSSAAGALISQGITNAGSGTALLTVADLNKIKWRSAGGVIIPVGTIIGFNASTSVVSHKDPAWSGILVSPSTIAWTKNTGETDTWTEIGTLSGPRQLMR